MQRRRILQATSALATSLGAALGLPSARAQGGPPIVLGVIGISFHAVVGAVVQQLLAGLGQATQVLNAPHDEMFRRLGVGEVDLLLTAWVPDTHDHLSKPLDERIAPLAVAYRDARLFWAVPDYVDPSVASIADLAGPGVAARMDKTITSIGPSAGLSVRSVRTLQAYGLKAAGYRVLPGPTDAWVAQFRSGVEARRWLVMPLWQPQFLMRTHALRLLADPQGSMGGRDEAVIVASRRFLDRADARVLQALRRVDIGIDGVTEMDLSVNVRGLSPQAAAAEWMAAGGDRVRAWSA